MFRRKTEHKTYDRENQIPALMCSICTGEQTAGFKDRRTGKFTGVMLVRTPADLERFKEEYEIETVVKIY